MDTTQGVPQVRLDSGSDDDTAAAAAADRSIPGVAVDACHASTPRRRVSNVTSPPPSSVRIVLPEEATTFSYAEVYSPEYLASLTPLFLAVAGRYAEAVELLLDHGACPNVRDRQNGCTPLHLTVSEAFNSWPCALSLLRHGARVHAPDARGVTPCDLCPQLAQEQIGLLLHTLRRTAASVSPGNARSRPRLDFFRGKFLRRRRIASDPNQRSQRKYSFISANQSSRSVIFGNSYSDIVTSDRLSSAASSGIAHYYKIFGSTGHTDDMEVDGRTCDSERVSGKYILINRKCARAHARTHALTHAYAHCQNNDSNVDDNHDDNNSNAENNLIATMTVIMGAGEGEMLTRVRLTVKCSTRRAGAAVVYDCVSICTENRSIIQECLRRQMSLNPLLKYVFCWVRVRACMFVHS